MCLFVRFVVRLYYLDQPPLKIPNHRIFNLALSLNFREYLLYRLRRIILITQINPEISLSCLQKFWDKLNNRKWFLINNHRPTVVIQGNKFITILIFYYLLFKTASLLPKTCTFHIRPDAGLGGKEIGRAHV